MFLVSVLCGLLVGMVVNCDARNKVVQREFSTIWKACSKYDNGSILHLKASQWYVRVLRLFVK
jgi:hypothetical protein